ncbi:MAG: glucose 1-dehydrogenase [Myxococcales bacterium]|nr:glucose 1-dehydrogenase [Myxococcales bacterium]
MSDRLAGRVAVVTGGSRGIGRAIARAFAKEGAIVVIASRKAEGLISVAEEIASEGGVAHARPLHVGRVNEIGSWWDAVQEEIGRPSILINNAGTNPYFGPMMNLEWAAFDKTFEVNVKGPLEMTRQLVRRHQAQSDAGPASVVSVASILGAAASPLQGVYGMTKASIISMTKTLAVELGETGIRVNAIAPGVIDTKLAAAITTNDDLRRRVLEHTALNRVGQPEEIAGIAVFLASEESSYVTGQTFFVDGGWTIT